MRKDWELSLIEGSRTDGTYYNAKGLILAEVTNENPLVINMDNCNINDDFIVVGRGIRKRLREGDTVVVYEYMKGSLYIILAAFENQNDVYSEDSIAGLDTELSKTKTELNTYKEKLNKLESDFNNLLDDFNTLKQQVDNSSSGGGI